MRRHKDEAKAKRDALERLRGLLMPLPETVPPTVELNLRVPGEVSGENLVTLSTHDWNHLWTRKQRFALQFARQGNRVLYVEAQFHWLSYVKHFRRHWRRLYLFLLGPRFIEDNLYVYTPPLLIPAFQMFPSLAVINNFVLGFLLKRVLNRLGMSEPVLWLYTHYNKPLIKMLGSKKALYECVDDYAGASGLLRASVVRAQEKATLKSVDAAIVTADGLKESRAVHNRNLHVVHNAANVAHFNRAVIDDLPMPGDLAGVPRPRLVFLGAIAYWIDQALLEYLAVEGGDWQIVLIGPVLVDVTSLRSRDNVHILGSKPHDQLPSYLAHCDVALNPYKIDDVSRGCSPIKVYEYLAAGLPVVSTDMPEAARFGGFVKIASSHESFASAVSEVLGRSPEKRRRLRQAAMRESQKHSWENRFARVERIAAEVLR